MPWVKKFQHWYTLGQVRRSNIKFIIGRLGSCRCFSTAVGLVWPVFPIIIVIVKAHMISSRLNLVCSSVRNLFSFPIWPVNHADLKWQKPWRKPIRQQQHTSPVQFSHRPYYLLVICLSKRLPVQTNVSVSCTAIPILVKWYRCVETMDERKMMRFFSVRCNTGGCLRSR